MALDEAGRARARQLIRRWRDPTLPDEAAGPLLSDLERLLCCPRVTSLLFSQSPEPTDDEVIDRALQYRPIEL